MHRRKTPACFVSGLLVICSVLLFTREGLIYSSLGLSSPGLQKSLSLTINLHHVCFLSAVTDDLPFNSLPPRWRRRVVNQRSFLCCCSERERERVLGGWRQWWWWWWCVFLIILASRKRGTVTSACCALLSPHKWTNYLWEESSEEGKLSVHMRGQRGRLRSSYTGTHEYHSGQRPCARWRRHVACRHSSPCWVHLKKKSSDIKGTVHPKMKIQSVSARPRVDGKPGEVSFLELHSKTALQRCPKQPKKPENW